MGLLELSDVSRAFGDVRALQHVDLSVAEGEWVSVVGPSGSGKSTLMNIVGCMDRPTSGSVMLDGDEIASLGQRALTVIRRRKIGLVFQQFHLVNYLSAVENVMLAQYYHSLPDQDEALQALERVGLRHRARHLPRQLSGGEQQRVCVARALINYPRLILADEPTGNLDGVNERIIMEFLHQLHDEGSTLIVVTHDPTVAEQADRIVTLVDGQITQDRATRRQGAADSAPSTPGPSGPEAGR